MLEDANLKLAAVATDITGVSSRAILSALSQGEEELDFLVELARGRLRLKLPELKQALEGRVTPHHRFMLGRLLTQLEFYEAELAEFNQEIEQRLELGDQSVSATPTERAVVDEVEKGETPKTSSASRASKGRKTRPGGLRVLPHKKKGASISTVEGEGGEVRHSAAPEQLSPTLQALRWLDSIPGISQRIGEIVLAEIGLDLKRFPSAAHLASWVGLCPGHNESGGKRRSGKTTKGSRWLRQALVEAAQAAMHTKDTYLAAQGRRLSARLGKKKAVIAVAHSIIVIIYHVLSRGESYKELGGDYFSKLDQEAMKRRALQQLERLGYKVELAKAG